MAASAHEFIYIDTDSVYAVGAPITRAGGTVYNPQGVDCLPSPSDPAHAYFELGEPTVFGPS